MTDWLSIAAQVAVLGGLAYALERFGLRRMPARWRELLWAAVLVRLLLPAQWFPLPGLEVPGSVASAWSEVMAWALGGLSPQPGSEVAGPAAAGAIAPAADVPAGSTTGGAGVLPLLWVLGAVVVALRLWRGHRAELRALTIGSQPAGRDWRRAGVRVARLLGLRRIPGLRETTAVTAPCVVGVRRPTVFVPPAVLTGLRDADRDHVLLHEFAHVARRDVLRALVVSGFRIVFWWHPIVWLAASRLTFARELGADARAAGSAPGGTLAYGETLLRWSAPTQSPVLAAVGWSPRSRLGSRIEALVRPFGVFGWAPGTRPRAAFGGGVLVVGCALQLLLAMPAASANGADTAGRPALLGQFELPPDVPADLRELPGCMQRRLLVLAQLAAAERQDSTSR
ncbi:MAG: M56 family metallopeptidase [bacterium]|nr:M56 family metallopeptidase [bacterium]